ncbi:hypothetical protein Tco_1121712 [Tanacetum coccineum]|uniref:Reverse transcriptase domain-containing protein n=1 Tax=Tanacetum coccineum TaxID=301880 RepID=A0ABQ5J0Q2_9ASTR
MRSILSITGKGYGYKYGGQRSYRRITTQVYLVTSFTQIGVDTLGPAGRATAAPRGGRTGGRTGRGGSRSRGRSGDQGNGRLDGQGVQVGGQGTKVNNGVDGVPDFSPIITQQLQNLLPTILAQVGDQGSNLRNGRNQNGDAVNDNIRGDVKNVIENNDRMGCTYKEFLACNPKEYDGKGGAIVYIRWIEKIESVQDMSGSTHKVENPFGSRSFNVIIGMDWLSNHKAAIFCYDKVVRIPLLDGKVLRVLGERPEEKARRLMSAKSKEQKQEEMVVVRDFPKELSGQLKELLDKGFIRPSSSPWGAPNKRTRTENAFATTINPVRRENKGHLAKDCRVVLRNVNLVNARNPAAARGACFECGGSGRAFMLGVEEARHDPYIMTGFSYKIDIASGQLVEIDKVIKGCKLEIDGHVFDINLIPFKSGSFDVIIGERPKEKARHLMSAKAKEQKQEGMVVERDFSPRVFQDD